MWFFRKQEKERAWVKWIEMTQINNPPNKPEYKVIWEEDEELYEGKYVITHMEGKGQREFDTENDARLFCRQLSRLSPKEIKQHFEPEKRDKYFYYILYSGGCVIDKKRSRSIGKSFLN